jgi:hypothetical protein
MDNETEGDAQPEQTVAVTQAENLTGNDLVQRLLDKRTGQAEPAKEETEPAEQTAEEEEPEATPEAEEEEVAEYSDTPEPEAPSETDVLSKYGINLDNLSAQEAESLAKQLGSRAVKRFGKLTGQKKELQERLEALETHYQQALEEKKSGPPPASTDEAKLLAHITTQGALEEEVSNTNELIDWIGDQLDNESEYDDDGNEYLAELNGQKYNKGDLKRIRANARVSLRKQIPDRKNWIDQRSEFDTVTAESFKWLNDDSDEKRTFFLQMKQHPDYKGFIDTVPAGNFALGLMSLGWEQFQQQAQSKTKKKPASTGSPPPMAAPQAALKKQIGGRSTDLEKAMHAAELRFQQSGSETDLIALRKLKAQARS